MTQAKTARTALVVVAVIFVTSVVAVVLAFIFAPPGADLSVVVGPVLGSVPATIAAVALLVQVRNVDAKVDRVADDTYRLTNGLLDAKVRAAFGDVAHPSFIRHDAHDLLDEDRRVRDEAHKEQEPPGTMADGDPHRP